MHSISGDPAVAADDDEEDTALIAYFAQFLGFLGHQEKWSGLWGFPRAPWSPKLFKDS